MHIVEAILFVELSILVDFFEHDISLEQLRELHPSDAENIAGHTASWFVYLILSFVPSKYTN